MLQGERTSPLTAEDATVRVRWRYTLRNALASRPIAVLALGAMLACSDARSPVDITEPPGPPTPSGTGPVSTTLDPKGGTLSATTAEGVVVTLEFPEGAVRAPTDVTIRPLPAVDGEWMRVALEPPGLMTWRSVRLKARFPAGTPVQQGTLLIGSSERRVSIDTEIELQGRTLATQLPYFGAAADGTLRMTGVGRTADDENVISAAPVDCAALVAVLQQAFDDFVATGANDRAFQLVRAISGALAHYACPGVEQWLETGSVLACDSYAAAVGTARSTPTSSFGDFSRQLQPVTHWYGITSAFGADCADDYTEVFEAEIADYMQLHGERLATLTSNDWSTFADLKDEARDAYLMAAGAYMIGLEDSNAQLTAAFRTVIDRMRDVAYSLCARDGWNYPLSRLTSRGFHMRRDIIGIAPGRPDIAWPPPTQYASFTDAMIFDDLQYCGTAVELRALTTSAQTLASEALGTHGQPAQHTAEASLDTPTRGVLRLDGEIFGFRCWDQTGDREVIVALDGQDVLTLRRSGHRYVAGQPAEIDLVTAASEAGITAREGIMSRLTVRRKREECLTELWGPPVFELFDVQLSWRNPTLEVTIDTPHRVEPGSEVPVDVRVSVIDQFGVGAYFANVDVQLVVGGAISGNFAGRTDADGYFRTTLQAPMISAHRASVGGLVTAAAATDYSMDAVAVSSEGVTAKAFHSAVIASGPLIEGEFRGTYVDAGTCVDRNDYVRPMTIWLFDHEPDSGKLKLALDFGHGGSIATASRRFRGTITSDGKIEAVGVHTSSGSLILDDELKATLTGDRLTGRFYEHCDNATADIWEFELTRHS